MTVYFETLREGDGKVSIHPAAPPHELATHQRPLARRPFWRYVYRLAYRHRIQTSRASRRRHRSLHHQPQRWPHGMLRCYCSDSKLISTIRFRSFFQFDTSKIRGRQPFCFVVGNGTVVEAWDQGQ